MAVKAIIDKLEDAPEALREHYVAGTADNGADGKFILGVEAVSGFALENVEGLKSALGKERTTRERLERDVVKFKDLDPDKARAALTELEELKKLDPNKEADKIANSKFEAAKAQLLEQHTKEVEAKDARIAKLTGAVDGLTRKQQATVALAEAKGSVELLLPHVLAHTRVKETEAGDFVVEVVDAAGNARIADAKGSPMDIKGLVAEMRQSETFARAFDGDGHSGSGKEHDNPGGKVEKGDFGGDRKARTAAIATRFKLPAA
jgi:hypothetical protein